MHPLSIQSVRGLHCVLHMHYVYSILKSKVASIYPNRTAYYALIFTYSVMLQCSLNLPIMLNIMLKNKNCG